MPLSRGQTYPMMEKVWDNSERPALSLRRGLLSPRYGCIAAPGLPLSTDADPESTPQEKACFRAHVQGSRAPISKAWSLPCTCIPPGSQLSDKHFLASLCGHLGLGATLSLPSSHRPLTLPDLKCPQACLRTSLSPRGLLQGLPLSRFSFWALSKWSRAPPPSDWASGHMALASTVQNHPGTGRSSRMSSPPPVMLLMSFWAQLVGLSSRNMEGKARTQGNTGWSPCSWWDRVGLQAGKRA